MLFINHNCKSSCHLLRAYYGPATFECGSEFLAFWVFRMILWNELHQRGNWDSENNWGSLITYSGTSDRDKIPTHVCTVQGLCSFRTACFVLPGKAHGTCLGVSLYGTLRIWFGKYFLVKSRFFHRWHHKAGTVESGICGDYTVLWNYAQVKKADKGKIK